MLRLFRRLLPDWTNRPRQMALLRLLIVGIEHSLPLAPLVEALADDESGRQQPRLRRLADLLGSGTNLPDALEQVPGVLPDDVILAVRFGAQSGTLCASLKSAASLPARHRDKVVVRIRHLLAYLLFIGFSLLLVTIFLMVKIMPTYQVIFDDFETYLPPPTQLLIASSEIVARYWPFIVLVVIIAVWALWSEWIINWIQRYVLSYVSRPLVDLTTADLLSNLAVASASGRPLAGAISTLARYHHRATFRNKLLYLRNELEQGATLWPTMQEIKLINSVEVELLEASGRAGNESWAVDQIARHKTARANGRVDRIIEIAGPIMVILLGLVVGFVCVAMFLPLVSLVANLS